MFSYKLNYTKVQVPEQIVSQSIRQLTKKILLIIGEVFIMQNSSKWAPPQPTTTVKSCFYIKVYNNNDIIYNRITTADTFLH